MARDSGGIETKKLALRDLLTLAAIAGTIALGYGRFTALETKVTALSTQIADVQATLNLIAPHTVRSGTTTAAKD